MLLPVLISQNLTRVETVSFSGAQIEFSALFGNHSPTFFFCALALNLSEFNR